MYEGEIVLQELEKQIQIQKSGYIQLEIFLMLITIVIVGTLGYFIAKQIKRINEELYNQKVSIRSILDAQPNIVIVSDGYNMTDANAALFEYFDQYDSFENFSKDHACICDFFKMPYKEDISDYIVKNEYDGIVWAEYVLIHPERAFKVAMEIEGEFYHFSLTVKKRSFQIMILLW